jgi:hypothetical protein
MGVPCVLVSAVSQMILTDVLGKVAIDAEETGRNSELEVYIVKRFTIYTLYPTLLTSSNHRDGVGGPGSVKEK